MLKEPKVLLVGNLDLQEHQETKVHKVQQEP